MSKKKLKQQRKQLRELAEIAQVVIDGQRAFIDAYKLRGRAWRMMSEFNKRWQ